MLRFAASEASHCWFRWLFWWPSCIQSLTLLPFYSFYHLILLILIPLSYSILLHSFLLQHHNANSDPSFVFDLLLFSFDSGIFWHSWCLLLLLKPHTVDSAAFLLTWLPPIFGSATFLLLLPPHIANSDPSFVFDFLLFSLYFVIFLHSWCLLLLLKHHIVGFAAFWLT